MRFYPGQLDYLTRLAPRDYALLGADTGTGKSLMTIALIRLKLETPHPDGSGAHTFSGRALILAPQGTARQSDPDLDPDDSQIQNPKSEIQNLPDSLPQWRQELARFAPGIPTFDLFHWEHAEALLDRYGDLPPGIYLSYYEAFFRNGAREHKPASWNHAKFCQHYQADFGPFTPLWTAERPAENPKSKIQNLSLPDPDFRTWATPWMDAALERQLDALRRRLAADPRTPIPLSLALGPWTLQRLAAQPLHDYTAGLGEERHGLRGLAAPSLATRLDTFAGTRHHRPCAFDLVALDEAHAACHLDAQLTQDLIRLRPRYRYAATATPIPNLVTDLFPLMGWLCVPDWYLGARRNPAWPYAREDAEAFRTTFLSEERDYTQEELNQARNPRWRGKCIKTSPVISAPARLLKLLTPTLAHISKPDCNPALVPCQLVDVRVAMGKQQSALYSWFMDRGHISGKNGLIRARKQIAFLRGICADPAGFEHGGPRVHSNLNPKTLAVLELVREALARGEQCLIVSARLGQTQTFHHLLAEALGPERLARIDSSLPAQRHALEAARFKRGEARVLLMGIKCAKAYSFECCPNLIIASLEYSYGSLHQALGRIWRVTSPKPVRAYCVLHQGTLEEIMFDIVATKQDAATICLRGERVPRDYHPVDLMEVLAQNAIAFDAQGTDEALCRERWPALLSALRATRVAPERKDGSAGDSRLPPWKRYFLAKMRVLAQTPTV